MYKPDSNELTEVHQFDNVQDVYVANDRLYILDRSSNITIYNLLTQQEEKKLQYGDHASSIGADSKGRIYLAESNGNGDDYDLYLLSPERNAFIAGFIRGGSVRIFAASMKVTGTIM